MQVILISFEGEKYPIANVCELESSMNPFEKNLLVVSQFASGKKILLAKLCKGTEKLASEP